MEGAEKPYWRKVGLDVGTLRAVLLKGGIAHLRWCDAGPQHWHTGYLALGHVNPRPCHHGVKVALVHSVFSPLSQHSFKVCGARQLAESCLWSLPRSWLLLHRRTGAGPWAPLGWRSLGGGGGVLSSVLRSPLGGWRGWSGPFSLISSLERPFRSHVTVIRPLLCHPRLPSALGNRFLPQGGLCREPLATRLPQDVLGTEAWAALLPHRASGHLGCAGDRELLGSAASGPAAARSLDSRGACKPPQAGSCPLRVTPFPG